MMSSTPKSQTPLSPDVLRAVYRRGLELSPGERAVFEVLIANGKAVRLSVGNDSEGLVEITCADKGVCAQLRKLVGISVFLRAIEASAHDDLSPLSTLIEPRTLKEPP